MKKILLAAIAVGMMTTSAMAAVKGSVNRIATKSDGSVRIVINNTSRILNGTANGNKAMLALVLTARSANYTVEAYDNGEKWTSISILPNP